MLQARDIQVHLGKKQILHGINLFASPGMLTTIIGPNGSGKTTMLRALTGEIPFEGQAHLNGIDIARASIRKMASIRSVLPQSTQLSFPFTVFEVVKLGFIAGIHPGALIADRIDDVLSKVGLSGFGGRYYQELSGGEQQRVQFARVLAQIGEPFVGDQARYLFLDEPISSLDIKHQIQIMNIARDFANHGGGVIAILHDLNLTAHFADHVVLLDQGRVRASGPPQTVLTTENLEAVYGCPMAVGSPPEEMELFVLPRIAQMNAMSPNH